MATQTVTLSLKQPIEIGNVDLVIGVRQGGRLAGTLTISKGSIDWRKAHAHESVSKTWAEFASIMIP